MASFSYGPDLTSKICIKGRGWGRRKRIRGKKKRRRGGKSLLLLHPLPFIRLISRLAKA